jgi:hypothetical protein
MCRACDSFDSAVAIHGPRQLERLVSRIRAAISHGVLRCNDFESSRALIGQKPFSELDLDQRIPDVLRYYFDCASCGSVFALAAESFHAQGGTWSKL